MSQLKNRWLVNIILIAVVLVLAGTVYFKRAHEGREGRPALTPLQPTEITRIRIERPGDQAVVLEKTGPDWRLIAPVAARANTFNVDQLLSLASVESDTLIPAGKVDLKQFGLDKPQARVWLNDIPIEFGAIHPFKNLHYVRYVDIVHLIPSHRFAPVAYSYTHYIDTRLFAAQPAPVAIELPGFAVELKDGTWRRVPEIKKLSSDRINGFVEDWRHAQALIVERYSGKPAQARIRIGFGESGQKSELTLGILAHNPEFVIYRQDEGLEYHFPKDTGDRLMNLAPE